MNTATFEKIEKEMISGLKFPDAEVLSDNDAIKERLSELNDPIQIVTGSQSIMNFRSTTVFAKEMDWDR